MDLILPRFLYLIYINDLSNVTPNMFFILFDDNSNVFYSHISLDTLLHKVNLELISIAEWFVASTLTLNLDKFDFILVKSHRKNSPT